MVSFLLVLQIILWSISSITSSSSGQSSSASNASLKKNESFSIVVADLPTPKLLPNGKYDECAILLGISVFRPYLERKAVLKYESCHYTERIFISAVEKIFYTMKLDYINIFVPEMIKLMAQEYAEMARLFCRQNSIPKDQYEVVFVKQKAMILAVFIHESISRGYLFTNGQNSIFLEFIYRFSSGGIRYTLAFQCLYAYLHNGSLLFVYDLIAKYFDPKNPALPVFFLKFQPGDNVQIKIAFIAFVARIYEKVSNGIGSGPPFGSVQ